RQPLQDPCGGPPGGLRPRLGRLEPVLEDLLGALTAFADEPRQAHMQPGRVTSDRNIGQLPDAVVAPAPLGPTRWAEPQDLARYGLDNGLLPLGDASPGDVHPELESAADDIGNRTGGGRAGGRFHR